MKDLSNVDIKVQIVGGSWLLAKVSLDFGPFEIDGFRISRSKKEMEYWVQGPSAKLKDTERYFRAFWVKDDNERKELDQRIIGVFKEECRSQGKLDLLEEIPVKSDEDEELDLDDIPI